jgi:hypothetical protein
MRTIPLLASRRGPELRRAHRASTAARRIRRAPRVTTRSARNTWRSRHGVRRGGPARVDRLRLRRDEGCARTTRWTRRIRCPCTDGTKLAARRSSGSWLPEHFIVRTSYVYGAGDDYASGALERLRRARSAAASAIGSDRRRSSRHLASRLLPLLLTAGSGRITWPDPSRPAGSTSSSAPGRSAVSPGTVEPQEMASLGLPRRVRPTPPSRAPTSSTSGSNRSRGWTSAVGEWIGGGAAEATA